jgi:hypothetical protein
MSGQPFNLELIKALKQVKAETGIIPSSVAARSLDVGTWYALDGVTTETDVDDLISDTMAIMAQFIDILVRSTHGGHLCEPCLAVANMRFSAEILLLMGADDDADEPDDEPSETPPFSGSIN